MGSLSRRDAVAKLPIWGLTCGYFRDLWTEKSKLASMLVVWSPRGARVPMAWGGCVGAAGYPMGCQIGRLTRHETPLPVARPSQATKISKPNRFAYPFRSRPRGVPWAPILNLRPAKTPRCRDTANLGFGVRARLRAECRITYPVDGICYRTRPRRGGSAGPSRGYPRRASGGRRPRRRGCARWRRARVPRRARAA